jgi:hypothetical protein
VNNAFTSDKTLKEGYVRDPCSCYFEMNAVRFRPPRWPHPRRLSENYP